MSKIDEENNSVEVQFEDGKTVMYPAKDLEQIMPAYATTIHKSQGNEFPIVVLILASSQARMLQRNLLYTGITRAKQALVLVSSKKALASAVHTNDWGKCYTKLTERLTDIFHKG